MRNRVILAVLLLIIVSAPVFALVPRMVFAELGAATW